MIISARDIPDGLELGADICIVGAGAAGISLALQLIDAPVSVLLLESGGLTPNRRVQSLYCGTVTDARLHCTPDRYRQRCFGGSTTIWGGRCMPFDPIDFEERDYVPYSGWPIGIDALMPYYPRANALCEAGEFAYRARQVFRLALPPMMEGFVSAHFTTDSLERFSCPTDFGARYRQRLRSARNVRVVLDANVTRIGLSAGADRVESLTVRSLSGRRLAVYARDFVLATGGLEVARLMLASRDRQPNGVGNDYGLVGRFYMCHIAGTLGRLRFNGPLSAVHYGYEVSDEGIYCRRRIALHPGSQRALRVGNFAARLHHPRIADPAHRHAVLSMLYLAEPIIPYEYGQRLRSDGSGGPADWMRHALNVAGGPLEAWRFAWHMLRDYQLSARRFPSIIIRPRANLYSLDFHVEQQPNFSSRVFLNDRLDELAMPRLTVDWRYTAGDVETVRRPLHLLATDLRSSGIGEFEYDPEQVEEEVTRYGAYGGHHIGTTRMGTSRRDSVVDLNCRVHGMQNLFIASSAVFPTSSQANPTLTIVALALRLAAHLKTRIVISRVADALPGAPSGWQLASLATG